MKLSEWLTNTYKIMENDDIIRIFYYKGAKKRERIFYEDIALHPILKECDVIDYKIKTNDKSYVGGYTSRENIYIAYLDQDQVKIAFKN